MTITGTWSYSGDPSVSTRDALRFRIGDTSDSAPLLGDAELDFLLVEYDDEVGNAAVAAVRRLLMQWARFPMSKSVDGLSISYGDLVSRYTSLLEQLKAEAQTSEQDLPTPWAPLTMDEKREFDLSDETGDPYDAPYFTLWMDDFPGNNP